jgi:hypothetical protein
MLPCLVLLLPALGQAVEIGNDIRDTAARVDYGFYTEDLSLIAAARDAVAERSADPWTSYLRAYASYRAAQLTLALDRPVGQLLDDCISTAEAAAEFNETEIEATVLIAACSALSASAAPVRSLLHQRRYRRAADRIQAREPANPRFQLIAFTSPHMADPASRPTPHALIDAFAERGKAFAFPDWGEAEALTVVAVGQLEAGDRRGARDLVEAALLKAPDYHAALKLKARISHHAATD